MPVFLRYGAEEWRVKHHTVNLAFVARPARGPTDTIEYVFNTMRGHLAV